MERLRERRRIGGSRSGENRAARTANKFSRAAVKFRWKFPFTWSERCGARPAVVSGRATTVSPQPCSTCWRGGARIPPRALAKQIFKRDSRDPFRRENAALSRSLSFPFQRSRSQIWWHRIHTCDKSVRRLSVAESSKRSDTTSAILANRYRCRSCWDFTWAWWWSDGGNNTSYYPGPTTWPFLSARLYLVT